MAKILKLLPLFLLMLLLISCNKKIEFNQMEITKIIQEIENSVNQDNLTDFQKNSNVLTFFNFNSILCKIGNEKQNEQVFTIKPFTFESDEEYIEVEVFLNYLIDIKIKSANLDISPKLMQKIMSLGLPNKAYFYFNIREDQYILTKIKYPFRYKYMELL